MQDVQIVAPVREHEEKSKGQRSEYHNRNQRDQEVMERGGGAVAFEDLAELAAELASEAMPGHSVALMEHPLGSTHLQAKWEETDVVPRVFIGCSNSCFN
jgi:hypothetical protein